MAWVRWTRRGSTRATQRSRSGLMASRLDATSAVLVELSKEHSGASEQGLIGKIVAALHRTADDSHYVRLARSDLFQAPDSLRE